VYFLISAIHSCEYQDLTFGVICLPKCKRVSVVALQSYNFVQNGTEKQFSRVIFFPTFFSTIVLNDLELDFEGNTLPCLILRLVILREI